VSVPVTYTRGMSDSPTLYLIDGHAQMFRAFFAIRGGMTSPVTGEPTNALFAFAGMLIKMFRECRPDYAAIVFDAKGDTFRDELYADYKATREAPPEDFEKQIPRMFEMAGLFGLPLYEKTGYEADDLMASVAARCNRGELPDGLLVRLVAKDKDLEQVLSDRVILYDVQEDTTMDPEALKAKRGITPDQVIDYQALIGDTSDNIPGVSGIGPKTASKLLDTYGSLDALIENVDQLKGKQKERIQNAINDGSLELSRKLVTLDQSVAFGFDLESCKTNGTERLDVAGIEALFRELGFNRHIEDLKALTSRGTETPKKQQPDAGAGGLFDQSDEHGDTPATAVDPDADYRCIRTRGELDDVIDKMSKADIVAVDTETIGLGRTAELCGVCVSWQTKQGVYIPTKSPEGDTHLSSEQVIETLRPVLEDEAIKKVGHNFKYDLHVLRHAGVEVRGVAFDTMIAGFLLGTPGQGMDHLALSELDHTTMPISELIGPRPRRKSDPPQKTMDQVALDRVTPYAAEDADITMRLYERFKPRISEWGMDTLMDDVEVPLVTVLADMESRGIKVDPDELQRQEDRLTERINELKTQVLDAAGCDFNPDSPKQLADVLFNQLGFPVVKRTKTGPSTDIEVLEKLADADDLELEHEDHATVPALIVEYRQLTKLVGTYLRALRECIDPDTKRVHASFHQTGAATGRLSSSDPNLQNIPIRTEVGRNIRKAFVAEPGHVLISADYSQIELRVLAHLSEDEALIEAFRSGQDIHTAVAAQVFEVDPDDVTSEQRGHAKTINFGIIYGVTPYGLARRIESLDNEGAKKLIDGYKARFPGINEFLDQCVAHAKEHGYVKTMMGRRRAIEQVNSSQHNQRALGERLAINTVVQGSAADLIKKAMVIYHRQLAEQDRPEQLLLQIHDELVVEAPESEADAAGQLLRETMESAESLKVPLKVEVGVGSDWFASK